MSVLLETSLGDLVIDLEAKKAPVACTNFVKLCKLKAYNWSLFHTVTQGFTAIGGGNAAGDRDSGVSIYGLLEAGSESQAGVVNGTSSTRFFAPERHPKLKHVGKGVVSFVCSEAVAGGERTRVAASQFFVTLSDATDYTYLDAEHAVFGKVVEGFEVLDALNATLVDDDKRPFRDIRIKHTIILDDPFPDPPGLLEPPRSPSPPPEVLKTSRIAEDEDLFPDVDPAILEKEARDREAAARALTLEMIGDLPFAEIRPPENILFVCKLNPVTRDEDLELIFSRFGEIRSCEIIRDKKTQDSLCYAFIDFDQKEAAEEAYFKMDNVLIDDRRIHVDFSQSVSKLHAEFMGGKRRGLVDAEEFGGKGLQRKTQYRADGMGGDGGGREGDETELVFEHDGSLDREKKRVRRDDEPRGSSDTARGREDRDRERRDRDLEKRSGGRDWSDVGGRGDRDRGSGMATVERRDRDRDRDSERRYRDDDRRGDARVSGKYVERSDRSNGRVREDERRRVGRDDRVEDNYNKRRKEDHRKWGDERHH